VDSRRRTQDAAANRATQERGQDITREVGLAQVSKNTDFMNEIDIRVDALQEANPSLSDIDARKKALEERIEAQARAQLLANNVRTDTLELDRLRAAYSMAASRLANNPLAVTDSEAYRRAFDEEVRSITAQFSAPSASTTAEFEEGATARDAQGNRIVYRNGNWEPI
jgi:DNA repair exonuclease SbcCD ATPase subunit